MRKTRLLTLVIIAGLMAATALLGSCLPTTGTSPEEQQGSSLTSTLVMVGFIVLIFAMMYFLTIRPQRKRQQDQQKMLSAIQKGDRIITIGGLYGTVDTVSEDSVVIRVESGTLMRFARSAIATRLTQEAPNTGS